MNYSTTSLDDYEDSLFYVAMVHAPVSTWQESFLQEREDVLDMLSTFWTSPAPRLVFSSHLRDDVPTQVERFRARQVVQEVCISKLAVQADIQRVK
jgi:hypothetical protein